MQFSAALVNRPSPRPRAMVRSATVSTSHRSPGQKPVSSRAPVARCAAAELGPKRGPRSCPGGASSRVVPVSVRSVQNARPPVARAARIARSSSSGRNAGRSAGKAPTAVLKSAARSTASPYRKAGLRPAAGSSGIARTPQSSLGPGEGLHRDEQIHVHAPSSRWTFDPAAGKTSAQVASNPFRQSDNQALRRSGD
jgi:hypothetical protein